jgi:hypothetical protein
MENAERKYHPIEQFYDDAPEPTRYERIIFF